MERGSIAPAPAAALTARSAAASTVAVTPSVSKHRPMPATLRQANERDAAGKERDSDDPQGRDRLLLEADPAEVVDKQRGDRLPGEDHRDQRRGAELRRCDDRPEHVERSEQAAGPDPPGRVARAIRPA